MHIVVASRPAGWIVDLTLALQREGARVSLVDDGAELLEALALGDVDLVVGSMDLNGPDTSHALAMARTAGLETPFVLILPRRLRRLRENLARTATRAGLAGVVDEERAVASALGAMRHHSLDEGDPEEGTPMKRPFEDTEPRFHVLVADDDKEMRHLIVDELAMRGYNVEEARDGRELILRIDEVAARAGAGLTAAATDAPDLIVSDVKMPGASGLDALAVMRKSRVSVPVILMTSFGDDAVHAEGHRLGALAVFDKPLDVDELIDLVAGAVGRPIAP